MKEKLLKLEYLIMANQNISVDKVKNLLNIDDEELNNLIEMLNKEYEENHCFYLKKTPKKISVFLKNPGIEEEEKAKSLSKAAVEVIALLLLNKEPMTKLQIDKIRKTDSNKVLKNLLEKGFIEVVGKKKGITKSYVLYYVSDKVAQTLNLNDIEELQELVDSFVKELEDDINEESSDSGQT